MSRNTGYYCRFAETLEDRLDFVYYHPSFDEIIDAVSRFRYPLHRLSEYIVRAWTGDNLQVRDSNEKQYLYVKVENIAGNKIIVTDDSEFLSEDELARLSASIPKPGSVLVTRVASFGRCAVVEPDFKGAISDNVLCFELNGEIAPHFVSRFINSALAQAQLQRFAAGMGRGVLTYDRVGKLCIGVPSSREEQQRILSQVLSSEAHAVRLQKDARMSREKIEDYLLSQLGIILPIEERADYYHLFADDLKSQLSYGYYYPYLRLLRNSLDAARYRSLPLGELVTLEYDYLEPSKTPDKEYTYIGLDNVESGTGRLKGLKRLKGKSILSKASVIRPGRLVFAGLRPYLNKCFIFDGKQEAAGSTEFFVCEAKRGVSLRFLKWYLLSEAVLKQTKWILSGASYPRLDETDFSHLRVVIPKTIDDQIAIVDNVERQIKEVERKEQEANQMWDEAANAFTQLLLETSTYEATYL
jgi:restriction endonuclease S subunit